MTDKEPTKEQIKYFHKLTKVEFQHLVDEKITWRECAKRYSQPTWCNYPEAVSGMMGCWSLMGFLVTGENYCCGCDCYIKRRRIIGEKANTKTS